MELPAVLTITALYATGTITLVGTVFLCIWQLHYIQRTFLFPLLMRGGRGTPVLIVLFSVMFNMMNGWVNGWWLYHRASYDISWLWDPRFIAGLAVFIAGFIINLHSDHVLRRLRKPGETGYKVPMAGLHRFVASPNYFGELLEWTGWAILTWSWAGLAFAVFTAANLVPRAHVHWKWYRSTFPDYPAERRRIIPFIY
jgi:protein-S-isoprenylcysteine O-methyltransferase Ste14